MHPESCLSLTLILYRRFAPLARADPDHLFHGRDENLAVADAARFRRRLNGLDDLRHQAVGRDDLQLDLREKVDHILGAAIELGVPLLPPKPLHFGHGYALDADGVQGVLYFVEFERFDDCFNLLHDAITSDGQKIASLMLKCIVLNYSKLVAGMKRESAQ